MKSTDSTLKLLYRHMMSHYNAYKIGKITQSGYLFKIKPLDAQIDKIECQWE